MLGNQFFLMPKSYFGEKEMQCWRLYVEDIVNHPEDSGMRRLRLEGPESKSISALVRSSDNIVERKLGVLEELLLQRGAGVLVELKNGKQFSLPELIAGHKQWLGI